MAAAVVDARTREWMKFRGDYGEGLLVGLEDGLQIIRCLRKVKPGLA